jgi:hypothetical protein
LTMATTKTASATERNTTWVTPGKAISPSDWLASISFGEGLRRSVTLLRRQFRWCLLVFFAAGAGTSLLLLPIDQILASLAESILIELLNPMLDISLLANLVLEDLVLTFMEGFAVALLVFLLSCATVYHAFRSVSSLDIMRSKAPSRLSVSGTLGAGLLVAGAIALASVLVVPVPFLQVLLLFVPVCIVTGSAGGLGAVKLSVQLRRRHWQRLFCALVASYLFNLFAATIGQTLYLNLQAVLDLQHVSIGFWDSILQVVFTQLPVAMVAPLLPLLSLVFYPSATAAREDRLRADFLRRQQRRAPVTPYRPMPLTDAKDALVSPSQDATNRPASSGDTVEQT